MADAVSEANRTIAKTVAQAFGGKPRVRRFWDEAEKSRVDILTAADQPQPGVSSYSTIGLSDSPLYKDGVEYHARVELVGACGSSFEGFDNALATAAFCIINSRWFCYPGRIFPDIIGMFDLSSTMSHLMFLPPFLWEDTLGTLTLENKTVAWLLAIPISESELVFARERGPDALEDLFDQRQIDIYNLERAPVI